MTDPIAVFMQDGLIARVATEFADRGARGVVKYGVSMDDAKLTRRQWLQHAKEEAMDQVLYLQKLIDMEDAAEPRMIHLQVHEMSHDDQLKRIRDRIQESKEEEP